MAHSPVSLTRVIYFFLDNFEEGPAPKPASMDHTIHGVAKADRGYPPIRQSGPSPSHAVTTLEQCGHPPKSPISAAAFAGPAVEEGEWRINGPTIPIGQRDNAPIPSSVQPLTVNRTIDIMGLWEENFLGTKGEARK